MLVYVRGAGDIATGVAARLVRAGVSVVMADIAVPTCIRRTISFASHSPGRGRGRRHSRSLGTDAG